jgi:hypothetical protein
MADNKYQLLIEANVSIAKSLEGIQENLKQLNDSNILHQTKTSDEHKDFADKISLMMAKFWWLIIVLIAALMIVTGYSHVAKIFGFSIP